MLQRIRGQYPLQKGWKKKNSQFHKHHFNFLVNNALTALYTSRCIKKHSLLELVCILPDTPNFSCYFKLKVKCLKLRCSATVKLGANHAVILQIRQNSFSNTVSKVIHTDQIFFNLFFIYQHSFEGLVSKYLKGHEGLY